ncbi:MAG: substrate-binding domain-containing protein [Kiritimatiellales bacterium]|nr:substrate-binding domain-containing protein [Kiritimatiellales bacterium]
MQKIADNEDRKRVLIALGYNDPQLRRGIWRYCQEAGWILETSMMYYGTIPEFWSGDGIITLLYPDRHDIVDYVRNSGAAVVNLSADVDCGHHVLLDNRRSGEMAAEHLLDRGFTQTAFLKFTDASDILGRLDGFQSRIKAAGAEFRLLDWGASAARKSGESWMTWLQRELELLPKPIGILAQSDNRANHLISACEAIGLKVPDQVAIIGIDNNEIVCRSAPVPITSVDTNRERLAYEGAALLDRLMHGEAAPQHPAIIEPKEIVVRQSSNILAIEHPQVAAALRFIWEHFSEPISVEDILKTGTMSRCGLYRAFERYVGRSIGAELSRKRVEKAQTLLANTDMKHYEIAEESGFTSAEHFSRAFSRSAGTTPTKYRQSHS